MFGEELITRRVIHVEVHLHLDGIQRGRFDVQQSFDAQLDEPLNVVGRQNTVHLKFIGRLENDGLDDEGHERLRHTYSTANSSSRPTNA